MKFKTPLKIGALIFLGYTALLFGFQNCSSKGFDTSSVAGGENVALISSFTTYPAMPNSLGTISTGGGGGTGAPAPSRGVMLSYNGVQSDGPFFVAQNIGVQIYGYAQDDTYICVDEVFGGLICDDPKYMAKLPSTLYGYKGFTFNNGVWQANLSPSSYYTTFRITINNSKNEKTIKLFDVKGSATSVLLFSRHLVNGQLKNLPYKTTETIEVRVYGFEENDVKICNQINSTDNYAAPIAYCYTYDEFSPIPNADWSYQNGVWIAKFPASRFNLDLLYRIRFRDSKGHETVGGFIQVKTNTDPSFTVGP